MTRETSLEVYERLEASGLLSKKRLEVFGYVCRNPLCTALDAEEALHPRNRSTVNARFSELVKMGLIREVPGEYKVQHGNRRLIYEITGSTTPTPLVKKLTGPQKAAILTEALYAIRGIAEDQWRYSGGGDELWGRVNNLSADALNKVG